MCGHVYPPKVLASGDLLFAQQLSNELFAYSKNTQTIITNGLLQGYRADSCNISYYTPHFFSLTTLGIDNVESLEDILFSKSQDSNSCWSLLTEYFVS